MHKIAGDLIDAMFVTVCKCRTHQIHMSVCAVLTQGIPRYPSAHFLLSNALSASPHHPCEKHVAGEQGST